MKPAMLPPLIIHDGSAWCREAAKVTRALVPYAEVIDISTDAGRERRALIDKGLVEGTLDMRIPPVWFKSRKEPQS